VRSDAELAAVFSSRVGQDMGPRCDSCPARGAIVAGEPDYDCECFVIDIPTEGVWSAIIRHDEDCRYWRAMNARNN
jgi:hypothetical protein